jgi:CCR4-NOT complex subunit CAF16
LRRLLARRRALAHTARLTAPGLPPFHTTELTCSGDLSYLGSQWRRTVASVGYDIPLAGDVPAGVMIMNVPGVDPARRDELITLLGVDMNWSMNRVSDGQRVRHDVHSGADASPAC